MAEVSAGAMSREDQYLAPVLTQAKLQVPLAAHPLTAMAGGQVTPRHNPFAALVRALKMHHQRLKTE